MSDTDVVKTEAVLCHQTGHSRGSSRSVVLILDRNVVKTREKFSFLSQNFQNYVQQVGVSFLLKLFPLNRE